MFTFEDAYNYLIEHNICGKEVIDIACHLNGSNLETLEEVLYYYTTYYDFEGYEINNS